MTLGWFRFLVSFVILSAIFNAKAGAQSPESVSSPALSAAPEPDETVPLAVPEATPLAIEYHRTGDWIWLFGRFWDLFVPLVVLFSGFSARLAGWTKRLGRVWYFNIALFLVAYLGLMFLLDWPVNYFFGYVRQHSYGLSNQSFAKWSTDGLLRLGVDTAGAVLFGWMPTLLIRKAPRAWWWIGSILMVPYIIALIVLVPIFYDPLFNDFGPMSDPKLEAKILDLAGRAGIEGGRVYQVNKSVDTNAVNAYVTGLFGTKRIVLWDTLLDKLNDREVLVVMGHEMGHYALNHVGRTVGLSCLFLVVGLFAIDRVGRLLIKRFHQRLGFDDLGSIAAVPLLIVLSIALSNVMGPFVLAFSRYNEAEADRFAMELTHMNHSGASAFIKLQRENLGVPYRPLLETIFRGSHPALGDRIEFCNNYHPWTEAKPSVYQDVFRP